MQGKKKGFAGAAVAGALLAGSLVATSVSAQTATPPGPGAPGFCPGVGVMGGVGPGVAAPAAVHDVVAAALGMTSQELWDAQAAGQSVAELAREKNVDLGKVVDAALAAHTAQLDAALEAGTLTQAQAEAMKAVMRTRLEQAFRAAPGAGPREFRPGGRGMMGGGFGPGWRGAP